MIYDCFLYHGTGADPELLALRLKLLSPIADLRLVLVEANRTHSGTPKPLYYRDWHHDLPGITEHADRIIAVSMTDLPERASPLSRENIQRAALWRALTNAQPDDLICVSDLDEMVRPEAIQAVLAADANAGTIYVAEQRLSYYYLNCVADAQPWFGTRMVRYKHLVTTHDIRFAHGAIVKNAGWHMSYLGGVEAIREKVAAYLHQEYNLPAFTAEAHIERCLAEGLDLFGRSDVTYQFVPAQAEDGATIDLPWPIAEDIAAYKHWLWPQSDPAPPQEPGEHQSASKDDDEVAIWQIR